MKTLFWLLLAIAFLSWQIGAARSEEAQTFFMGALTVAVILTVIQVVRMAQPREPGSLPTVPLRKEVTTKMKIVKRS
jgi:hypothetical protein